MTSYMDYTSPDTQFTYDVNRNTLFKKDACNYINMLSVKQLNTLDNVSLLDIFLSKSNVVEPHYHQNAAELVYCICGSAVVSLINPFTNELLHFPIQPGQVANVPQGWWHYEVATADNTHLLAVFNAPVPNVILGSDILCKTPANVLAHTYCLNEASLKEALAPVKPGTFIGPPADCCKEGPVQAENAAYTAHAMNQAHAMNSANAPSANAPSANAPYPYVQPLPQQAYPYQTPTQPAQGFYNQGYAQYYRQPYVQQPPFVQPVVEQE
ncbi:hypothetical protein GCM10010912_15650 [Paenibacillus albidus]|uniref:Cupin type-1 domain-containing protein n=1 Tax=Paenibacillus albidus TaxID=2041023 RepID=A0A917C572_9BACL|nr:hypothetical protein GCM10010912_15650 [Paenibacillus albidus]